MFASNITIKSNLKIILEVLIIIIVSLLFLFIFSAYVPFHMDEFCPYHTLSCHYYPLNMLNTFRESSIQYDLSPISNYYLPLRSFYYEGSFPCLLYYPLFKLWPSPYSARLLGLIMLALQAFFIYKLFKVDLLLSFMLLLSCMPYTFQHLIRGGLAFQLFSVFFICYLAQRWKISIENDTKYSWQYPLIIGIVIFLGVWNKLSYFFVLPSIFLLHYYFIRETTVTTSLKKNSLIKQQLILYAVAVIPTFILLNSTSRSGYKYYHIISCSTITNMSNLKFLLHAFSDKLAIYFFNPLSTAHLIFTIPGGTVSFTGVLLTVIIGSFLFLGIRQLYLRKIKFSFVLLNILLFFLVIFVMNLSHTTWAMHHVALSFPFLILALFYIYSKLRKNRLLSILLIVFVITNFSLYFNLTKLQHQEYDHPSKLKINTLLNKQYANQYVFIVIDWGMYYIKALYGKKEQCVLYIEPFDTTAQVKEVKKILNKIKRKPLFIGRIDSVSDLSLIKQSFPDIIQLQTDFDTGKWRIWYSP